MLTQKDSMEKDLEKLTVQEKEQLIRVSNLQILIKTFSPTGLVAYKIETLVKDLEDITNKYLLDMSDGRFQLGFKITSADKLDVIITDNGVDIDIFALSNGELARVNVSTLLAIRKLMQSLSNTTINLLILDETVESLDVDGKERLVEVLLKEEHLNTILVSHGFSHPLLEKINVVKENNVSRIE
jgi:DNA repair exonuclease SbcCD ATPase subunit